MQIEKVYEPQRFEPHWAQWWIDNGVFRAESSQQDGPVFSLVIPPPNVTGSLHMGHMLDHTVIDVATRWHRMSGFRTLWLPGMDHAGIATQMVVERQLSQEGVTRQQLGREEFERRIWAWKEQYGGNIKRQMIRLGTSCDWSRERFTLDEGLSRAVRETFVRLYEKGLIYRGQYMVNWCPDCQTAISDLETVHEERQGSLWHLRYPVVGSDRLLTLATTRPETMLGDTAVAIHPNDERYFDLHGKSVRLPLMDRDIPIILDEMVDPQFGTGVVKITPAHDPNDFEAGQRHNLPRIQVIDGNGNMTAAAGRFAGMERFAARKAVLQALEEQGLLERTEPHMLSIGTCQRSKTIIEPLVSMQWFVKMKPLAEPAIRVVEDGTIEFIPDNWKKTYFEWMYNIRDWCISRQLWWGHRIPAWHCGSCQKITVARETPTHCQHCGSSKIVQDTDVLDTWFSSGLWPFSTMGWPDNTPDLQAFYPTSLLVTGFDILFFWVARMIVLGLECTGEPPFKRVFLHGLVRDAERQKMSKTKGNVVDPLDVTERYGTDAVRFSLLQGAAPGTDISLTDDRLESARNFANKIWNAARFLQLNMERAGIDTVESIGLQLEGAALEDRWMASRLRACADEVNRAMEQHRYHEAAHGVYGYFWNEFCDWYLEVKKLRFQENSGLNQDWQNLLAIYEQSLRLLHPVMPFLTEELWQRLTKDVADKPISLALARFPSKAIAPRDEAAEQEMALLQELITGCWRLKADMKVDKRQVLEGELYARDGAYEIAKQQVAAVEKLGNVKLSLHAGTAASLQGAVRSTPAFDLLLRVPQAQNEAQRVRLEKELQQLETQVANHERQLNDETFLGKAPQKIVDIMRGKLAEYRARLEKTRAALQEVA